MFSLESILNIDSNKVPSSPVFSVQCSPEFWKLHNIDAATSDNWQYSQERARCNDERDPLNIIYVIYETPGKNCNLVYVGET